MILQTFEKWKFSLIKPNDVENNFNFLELILKKDTSKDDKFRKGDKESIWKELNNKKDFLILKLKRYTQPCMCTHIQTVSL